MSDVILGRVIYLDALEVDNLLESIEGGLVEQFKETRSKGKSKSGEGSIGIPATPISTKFDLGSTDEETVEIVRKTTQISRLVMLRNYLVENEDIEYINATDEKKRPAVLEGSLVEVRGTLEISKFWNVVDNFSQTIERAEKFPSIFKNLDNGEEIIEVIKYLKEVTEAGIAVYIKPEKLSTAKRGFDFGCILDPEKLRIGKNKLRGTVNVLARVEQVPSRSDIIYLYEFIPGFSSIINIKDLIDKVKGSPIYSFTERDIRLQYPTVWLSPIAIYS